VSSRAPLDGSGAGGTLRAPRSRRRVSTTIETAQNSANPSQSHFMISPNPQLNPGHSA